MKKILCFALPVFFLAAVVTAPGAEFWEKKDYTKWSQKECAKILENSPWSQDYTFSDTEVLVGGRSGQTSTDGRQPYIKYQVQFRSALPVRQAIVRQMQIAQKYDKFTPEQKQQFDKGAEEFLNSFPQNAIIVYVTYETNDMNRDLELARFWQSKTTDLLKNSVYLIPSESERISLAGYSVSQGGARAFQFVFPREIDGKPTVGPEDKKLRLEFECPATGGMGGRAFLEFKVEKMVVNGNLSY